MITIHIPTPLRKFTGNQARVSVPAENVSGAISALIDTYPELGKHLLDTDQQIRRFVRIYVGEDDINQLQGPTTQLKPGDAVSIIPAIAGGSQAD
ncbi:MAG: MoaD/ThiS family protein [Saprospiraceae bacterium]|nr:MoaD/ThiS family protein [Saprospiraceae bacterium]